MAPLISNGWDAGSVSRIAPGAAIYSVSGTLLTLVNKAAINVFPYACVIVLIQNTIAIILIAMAAYFFPKIFEPIIRPDIALVARWATPASLFIVMLISSLMALKHISAVTLVVLRNLTTIVVAIGERCVIGTRFSWLSVATLWGMLFGAAMYGASDLAFNATGYAWLLANILANSAYQVHIKTIVKDSKMSPTNMSFINNIISLPLLVVCSVFLRETNSLDEIAGIITALFRPASACVVLLSGTLGYLLSTSAFFLNTVISATSIMVLNNATKFAVILLSEAFFERSLTRMSTLGAFFVILFAYMYSKAHTGKQSALQCAEATPRAEQSHTARTIVVSLLLVLSGTLATYSTIASLSGSRIMHHDHAWARPYATYLPREGNVADNNLKGGVSIMSPRPAYHDVTPESCHRTKESKAFQNCDVACNFNNTLALPGEISYALPKANGTTAAELIDRALLVAWGERPPSIDLFVRTGCLGLDEMHYLLPSIELFWPRFLGKVIIVLDHADQKVASRFAPLRPTHTYEIYFEHVPCMSPRIFNQLSYLHADTYSMADYIVTIDSDCMFIAPVTPDLLFFEGRLLLAFTQKFQINDWRLTTEYFVGNTNYGSHAMVTQPVSFHRSTLPAFRAWYENATGECYTDAVARFSEDAAVGRVAIHPYCWMCQLWSYMNHTQAFDHYYPIDVDVNTSVPFRRTAIHTTYEMQTKSYAGDSHVMALQGLCRTFGSEIFPACAKVGSDYFDKVAYQYAGWPFATPFDAQREFNYNYSTRIQEAWKQALRNRRQ